MAASVDTMAELPSGDPWRSSLLLYNDAKREYGLVIPFADEQPYEAIDFCPWCGSALTSSVPMAS